MIEDRTLPFSLDAERAVLGVALAHGDQWAEVASRLTAAHFFRDAHQRIYRAMATLAEQSVEIDFLTVKELLARRSELDEIGGPAYLSALSDGVPRSTNVRHYAGIVREMAQLRDLVAAGKRLVNDAYDSAMPSAVVLEEGTRALLNLATPAETDAVPLGQAVSDFLAGLDRDRSEDVTPTGYRDVDELLAGGLRHGDLTIVAARPSVGKTAWGLTAAIAAATAAHPTVFFSLEMTRQALAGRAVASMARVDAHRLAARMLAERDYERLAAAHELLAAVPLQIHDAAGMTLTQVAAWCHRLKQRPEGLSCAMVDYLQLLVPESNKHHSRQDEVSTISRGLKRVAKEYDIAMVALSQLSRSPETRTDKRPHLSDLRESGALEQDADVAILLFREEMHKPTDDNHGIAEAIVAKQRNGPTGVIRLAFIKEFMRFENLALFG